METFAPGTPNMLKEIVLRTLVSVLFCVVFGYMFWQGAVFNRYHTAFQYIAFGAIGSIFFYSLRYGLRNAIAMLFVLAVINSTLVARSHGLFIVRDACYTIAMASTICLYFSLFHNRDGGKKLLEPLILAALFSIGNFFALLLLMVVNDHWQGITVFWVYEVFRDWFLIGLGIGIGIIVTENQYSANIRARFQNLVHGVL